MTEDDEVKINISQYGSPITGSITRKIGVNSGIAVTEPKTSIGYKSNQKQSITVKQIESCFSEAIKLIERKTSSEIAVLNVVKNTGMTDGSASIYIWNIYHMYKGELYKKSVSIMGLQVIIKKFKEQKNDNLIHNLIKSFKEHVKYVKQFYINEATQKEIISFEEEEIQRLNDYLLHKH